MPQLPSHSGCASGVRTEFTTTHWSVVLGAREGSSPDSRAALEMLCGNYWYPLYAYLRRRGHTDHDAADLVQGFFARLLELKSLEEVSASKGRFRSFLCVSLNNFVSDERDRANALKRGGGRQVIPLDLMNAEARFGLEPADDRSPEKLFDRRWALCLMEQTFARLEREYLQSEKAAAFARLRTFILPGSGTGKLAEAAAELGVTEEAAKKMVQRMRARCQTIFREQVAQTVADPRDVDAELRELAAVLADE